MQCFFSEVLATAILLIVVLAVTDKRNGPPPNGLVPLVLFITILGEGACLGMQTAYVVFRLFELRSDTDSACPLAMRSTPLVILALV